MIWYQGPQGLFWDTDKKQKTPDDDIVNLSFLSSILLKWWEEKNCLVTWNVKKKQPKFCIFSLGVCKLFTWTVENVETAISDAVHYLCLIVGPW